MAPQDLSIKPVIAVRGIGPPAPVVDMAQWAAWRWAGSFAFGLRTASSEKVVSRLTAPALPPSPPARVGAETDEHRDLIDSAFDQGGSVVRIAPSADRSGLLFAAADRLWSGGEHKVGSGVLVLAPTHIQADSAARRLRRAGYPVALLPDDWARARAGSCVVVGTMAAAYAPLSSLLGALVLDAHDEGYYAQAAPTWCAWAVVAERAERDGAPVVLVSPCPTLDVMAGRRLLHLDHASERRSWPLIEVVDRSVDDPRSGLFSDRVVRLARWAAEAGNAYGDADAGGDTDNEIAARRVICVLNRKGRARLLICGSCRTVARCERCSGPLAQAQIAAEGDPPFVCQRCGLERPQVCAQCGSTRFLALRPGVSKVREELATLAGAEVLEVSGPVPSKAAAAESEEKALKKATIVVGTEAVLHRVDRADAVVFLDFDSELMAPRLRAGEEALALLARAARLVSRTRRRNGSLPGAQLVVQTRVPEHPAIVSAVQADPSILSDSELAVREELALPPVTALARISGAAADAYGSALGSVGASGVEVLGPHDGEWRVVAPDHQTLCDLLASVPRPSGKLRIEVDPVRA